MKPFYLNPFISFYLFTILFLSLSGLKAQTTINFDDDSKWIRGAGLISSYKSDHKYVDGVFSATGGDALRETVSDKNGVPGALGIYAWRLRDQSDVEWIITISSGGVGAFSLDVRRWDEDPSPSYNLEYSVNAGVDWESVTHIDNDVLDNSNAWKTIEGTINSTNNNILIRLKADGGTQRIMVDNFVWYSCSATGIDEKTVTFSIWPNPASDKLNIKAGGMLGWVELVNIAGQTERMQNATGEKNVVLPVADLPRGIYFLRMTQKSGKIRVSKVIIK